MIYYRQLGIIKPPVDSFSSTRKGMDEYVQGMVSPPHGLWIDTRAGVVQVMKCPHGEFDSKQNEIHDP